MKKTKIIIFLLCVITCISAMLALAACNNDDTPNSYTINFDTKGGSAVAVQTVNVGQTVVLPTAPTKEKYRFVGWYTDAACTIRFDDTVAIQSNVTLYAGWERSLYTVSFDTKGGSPIQSTDVVVGGVVARPGNPTKTENTFLGWYSDAMCEHVFDFNTVIESDITLYAGWERIQYSVSFYDDNSNLIETKPVLGGDTVSATNKPTKTGYTFIGWFTDALEGEEFKSTTTVHSNLSIFARFRINRYTVSCTKDLDAAGTVAGAYDYDYNTNVTVTATTASLAYVFNGWYQNGVKVSDDLSYTFALPANDVSLMASWSNRPGLTDYTYTATADTLTIVLYNGTETVVNVPDGVTHIAKNAFNYFERNDNNYSCMYITHISLPDTVVYIGESAFGYCSNLETISLSTNLKSIGMNAFNACRKLTNINIPRGVTRIENYTFYGCGKLANVTIPDTVTSIGTNAFYICGSLTSIVIPDSVTTVSRHAFYMCSSATINCVAAEIPAGWDEEWKYQVGSVVWGYSV